MNVQEAQELSERVRRVQYPLVCQYRGPDLAVEQRAAWHEWHRTWKLRLFWPIGALWRRREHAAWQRYLQAWYCIEHDRLAYNAGFPSAEWIWHPEDVPDVDTALAMQRAQIDWAERHSHLITAATTFLLLGLACFPFVLFGSLSPLSMVEGIAGGWFIAVIGLFAAGRISRYLKGRNS